MFDIGFQELIMVFIVALFVVEPGKLPEFSRKLAKWINIMRGGIHEVTTHMQGEFKSLIPESKDSVSNLMRKMEAAPDSQRADSPKEADTEKERSIIGTH